MIKVLYFIESLAGGGAEKVLSDIVSNIDKSIFDVTVCTVSDNGVYQKTVKENCKVVTLLRRKDYESGGIRKIAYWVKNKLIYAAPIGMVYRLFVKEKYDVEVAFVEGYATKFISASDNSKSKKYAWVHTDVLNNNHADKHYTDKEEQVKAYRRFDRIIFVSEHVKKSFQNKFGVFANTQVIYNPVDIETIKNKSKEPIELEKNKNLQMVTVGRLAEQKGYLRLLKAVNHAKEYGDFSLWIIGEGNEKEALQKYIVDNQLERYVILLGFTENPYKYLSKADAFICSSYAEGYSTAATEALILEKPVFTVDCSGMKELFHGYICGEIIENTDESLIQMVADLARGKYDLSNYKDGIRKRIDELSLKNQMEQIEKVLNE